MNAIQAMERLRILQNGLWALDKAIDEANRNQDPNSRHALTVIKSEVQTEHDDLQRKLSEVSI